MLDVGSISQFEGLESRVSMMLRVSGQGPRVRGSRAWRGVPVRAGGACLTCLFALVGRASSRARPPNRHLNLAHRPTAPTRATSDAIGGESLSTTLRANRYNARASFRPPHSNSKTAAATTAPR
eukprot:1153009-Rhodomonas_salina.3